MSYQALAASWAAFCSRDAQQHDAEADFLYLQVFFTNQYGLGDVNSSTWRLQFPPALPGLSPLHSAYSRLVGTQAVSRHPKAGGWGPTEWAMLDDYGKSASSKQRSALGDKWLYLSRHQRRWCEDSVKPVLARYALGLLAHHS